MPASKPELRDILTGREAIVAFGKSFREELAAWGLLEDFLDLELLLAVPAERQPTRRTPLLLVFEREKTVVGAVLLFRHRGVLGLFHLVTTIDKTGRRSVFAPADLRVELAALAAHSLLGRGASLVNIDFQLARPDAPDPLEVVLASARQTAAGTLSGCQFALQRKLRYLYLPLAGSLDETLAGMGRRTRKNLRNYTRLVEKEQGATFVADVEISREAFVALSEASSYPVSRAMTEWRFGSLGKVPGVFLSGLRNRDGEWIALACGRRKNSSVELDWQLNRRNLARYTLSLVMRGCLIEHACGTGRRRLLIEGHTRSPIEQSFTEGLVYNLAVRRGSLRLRVFEGLARVRPESPPISNLVRPGRRWVDVP